MTSWHYRFILGQSGLKINNLLLYENFLMFLITNPWAAGSECGWKSVRIPGEKVFSVLTSVEDLDDLGQEVKFSELLITEDQRGWEQTSPWTPLLPAPLSVLGWKCTARGHEPRTALTLLAVIIFLWFSAFAQCNFLGGKDQQNKIKFPLHLTNQGKTRAPSKVEKHNFISYHCFDLILEKSVLCIEAWFLPESDEQKSNTSIIESLQELDKTVCKTPGTGNLLNKP